MSHIISRIVGGAGSEAAGIRTPDTSMTPEQQAALEQERKALSDQRTQLLQVLKDQNLLEPSLLESLGFTKDASGNYTDTLGGQFNDLMKMQLGDIMSADPETQRLNSLFRQRQIQALEGNSEADPNLERNIALQEQTLRNQLRAQLGSGYETSSAGIQALNDFAQRANESRFSSRQAILKNYAESGNVNANTQAALFAPLTSTSNLLTQRLGNVFNTTNMSLPAMNLLSNNAAGYRNLADAYFQQKQLGVNSQLTQEKTRGDTGTKLFGSILGVV